MARYFKHIAPLIDAIANRAKELGMGDSEMAIQPGEQMVQNWCTLAEAGMFAYDSLRLIEDACK